MTGIASFGMYDGAALQIANDRLWSAVAASLQAAGINGVPLTLDRTRPLEAIWDDPTLILAQTCGYPWLKQYAGRLRYVATPRYRASGCEGVRHRSRIIVRLDDDLPTLTALRGKKAAINDPYSNTGMNLLRAVIAPMANGAAFFSAILETGSHYASAAAVAEGIADIAAIDCVTFAHLQRERPDLTGQLRTFAWTDEVPCLPFVTAAQTSDALVDALRTALGDAIQQDREAASTLLLDGVEVIDTQLYDQILSFEAQAATAGYPRLA